MSWLYSRARVEACLPPNRLGCERSALWSWIGTVDAFSSSDKMNESYDPVSRYGMTFVPLTADRGAAELMLYLEDSLAKHSVAPRGGETLRPTFGLKCSE